eukprot:TRINITY_DN63686_c0_g1_i1.p1 TRINITY_DN63686_c0_g1~~TRINITY_DN63686_c0_g1_i1.p1  ORF type:complete len:140 (-),score=30.65 TRINITY_DN63686_c0_g1_i1:25-444(-)
MWQSSLPSYEQAVMLDTPIPTYQEATRQEPIQQPIGYRTQPDIRGRHHSPKCPTAPPLPPRQTKIPSNSTTGISSSLTPDPRAPPLPPRPRTSSPAQNSGVHNLYASNPKTAFTRQQRTSGNISQPGRPSSPIYYKIWE